LVELSKQRFRPPGAKFSKSYSLATLERWHYAYKSGGLDALKPAARCDRGRCQELTDEQRQLLLDIREEHPAASVPVILRTLVAEGRLESDAISASSVRRFYQEKGLDRVAVRNQARGKVRLRWQAERPGALWHADVCHGTAVVIDDRSLPVRIHGILDDASRYIIGLEAFHHERESEMLTLLVRAVRKHGPADALYLDFVPRHKIQVLFRAGICGRSNQTAEISAYPVEVGHITRVTQSESSQSIKDASVRQGGLCTGLSLSVGGAHFSSAAALVRMLISA
jgi:transposase